MGTARARWLLGLMVAGVVVVVAAYAYARGGSAIPPQSHLSAAAPTLTPTVAPTVAVTPASAAASPVALAAGQRLLYAASAPGSGTLVTYAMGQNTVTPSAIDTEVIDQANPQRLAPAVIRQSAISPDGKHLAYLLSVNGGAPGSSAWALRMVVMDVDGSNKHDLSPTDPNEQITSFCWSPDSSALGMTDEVHTVGANKEDGIASQIEEVDLVSGKRQRLTIQGMSSPLIPHGELTIAACLGANIYVSLPASDALPASLQGAFVVISGADGKIMHSIPANPERIALVPSTPDGARYAELTNTTDSAGHTAYTLAIHDWTSASAQTLDTGSAYVSDFAWSPDGTRLAYVLDRDGVSSLFSYDIHTAGSATLTPSATPASDYRVRWLDATRLALVTHDPADDLDHLSIFDTRSNQQSAPLASGQMVAPL